MPSIILSNAGGAGTGKGGRSGLLELGGGGFQSFDGKNSDMIPRSLWRDLRLDRRFSVYNVNFEFFYGRVINMYAVLGF